MLKLVSRWFGYAKKRHPNAYLRSYKMMILLDCKRRRGRPRKNWGTPSRNLPDHMIRNMDLRQGLI